MRSRILSEIRRIAAANGDQPPGQILFARESGIAEHQWRGKYWARWGDALAEAGLSRNEWGKRLDSENVLAGIVSACRHYGHFPTQDEIDIYRRQEATIPSNQAIRRHFGKRLDLIAALKERAATDETYADIAAILPAEPQSQQEAASTRGKSAEGSVYLIKSGHFYKIGRSDDIERRIKEIRTALPDKAALVHSIRTDDPAGIEAYWHQRFSEKRANGEWFKLNSLDVSAFKKRKFQ